jgi:hypothetical protein
MFLIAGWVGIFLGYCILSLTDLAEQIFLRYGKLKEMNTKRCCSLHTAPCFRLM